MTKVELIDHLIKVSGIKHRLETAIRNQFAQVPGGQTVVKEAKAKLEDMIDAIGKRYNNNFTEEQLAAWAKLYEDQGQEFVDAQIVFENELTELISAWMATAMQDAVRGMF